METLCSRLDSMALETVDDMESYLSLHAQLKSMLSSGFINLSKSRYIMGEKCVSQLQLPVDDCPLSALACVTKQTIGENSDKSYSFVEFKLVSELMNPNKPANNSSVSVDGLRKRTKDSPQPDNPAEVGSDSKVKNPLHWFGILVPGSLRQSQSSFQEALSLCIELANVQQKLAHSKARYQQMLSEKIQSPGE